MGQSIISNERKCYISGRTDWLELHHVFGGTANRKISDKYGFWVYLNHYWHNEPPCEQNMGVGGVHFNPKLRLKLEQDCQRKFEENHSREEFVNLIGRNFL